MHGAARGGIEQRRGIAAMYCTDRIVGVLPGRARKNSFAGFDFDKLEIERNQNARLASQSHQRAELRQTVEAAAADFGHEAHAYPSNPTRCCASTNCVGSHVCVRHVWVLSELTIMSSNRRLSKKALDFRIQVPSYSESIRVSVGGQKTSHLVICQMHAVWPLIHQNCDRSVRSGVGNNLCLVGTSKCNYT